ncbi:MAG: 16S rRNA (guanine(966)-N(2))-methyltransferase RsmD [Candidatus Methylacidiphilales bacterium]
MSRVRITSGSAGGLFIQTPPRFSSRPTQERVREAFFSSIAPTLPGARFLDLCAGSGAMGIEAASRGAGEVTLVEENRSCVATLVKNLQYCSLQARTLCQEASRFLKESPDESFDIIYADPPYSLFNGCLDSMIWRDDLVRVLAADGLLIWEHDRHSHWKQPAGLELLKQKRFGDTLLTFLQKNEGTSV